MILNLMDTEEFKALGAPAIPEKQKLAEIKKLINNPNALHHMANGMIFANVDIRLIDIDTDYQRIPKDINLLKSKWDSDKMDAIKISYRDGRLFAVDGFHRMFFLMLAACYDCCARILFNLTKEDEAQKFSTQDDAKTNLSLLDTYKANLVWHDPIDTTIKEVCDFYHLNVLDSRQSMRPSLSACRPIVKQYGKKGLEWCFDILHSAKWTEIPGGCQHRNLYALSHAYNHGLSKQKLDEYKNRLIEIMSNFDQFTICMLGSTLSRSTDKRAMMNAAILALADGTKNAGNLRSYSCPA